DLPDSEQEALSGMGRDLTPEDLHFMFDMALKGANDLTRASDPLLVLEMVLMRMASAPRVANLSGGARPASAPTQAPPKKAAEARSAPAPTPVPAEPAGPSYDPNS